MSIRLDTIPHHDVQTDKNGKSTRATHLWNCNGVAGLLKTRRKFFGPSYMRAHDMRNCNQNTTWPRPASPRPGDVFCTVVFVVVLIKHYCKPWWTRTKWSALGGPSATISLSQRQRPPWPFGPHIAGLGGGSYAPVGRSRGTWLNV